MKFCPALPGSRQYYKLFINYILRLRVKRFITARWDPSFAQRGSRFAGTKFSHVIASIRLGGIKKLIQKYPQKYISIARKYLYCVFTIRRRQSVRKKPTKIFVELHHFTEAATGSVLQKRCS